MKDFSVAETLIRSQLEYGYIIWNPIHNNIALKKISSESTLSIYLQLSYTWFSWEKCVTYVFNKQFAWVTNCRIPVFCIQTYHLFNLKSPDFLNYVNFLVPRVSSRNLQESIFQLFEQINCIIRLFSKCSVLLFVV